MGGGTGAGSGAGAGIWSDTSARGRIRTGVDEPSLFAAAGSTVRFFFLTLGLSVVFVTEVLGRFFLGFAAPP
jgi:hypothetical protein